LYARKEIDALISIGGDGSLTIANALHQKGLRVVGVPKTIDNDLDKTFTTFGFDTAVAFATECLDRLHSTAESHQRVMVVEVMGRYAGWIALHTGIAGNAHAVLIPEIPFDIDKVAAKVVARDVEGHPYTIVLVAEGAEPAHGHREVVEAAEIGHAERLGGIGERVGQAIQARTGKDTRVVVLGHLLRGGSPTSFDRLAAMRFGTAAVRAGEGQIRHHGGARLSNVNYVALEEVARAHEGRPSWTDTLQTARDRASNSATDPCVPMIPAMRVARKPDSAHRTEPGDAARRALRATALAAAVLVSACTSFGVIDNKPPAERGGPAPGYTLETFNRT
jgi:6-phosphofructokinase 1